VYKNLINNAFLLISITVIIYFLITYWRIFLIFRSDINGLRAIAVIAVVLFHYNSTLLPGGFAGVDVFFVISGFLMTGIIFKNLENNSFDLYSYYGARVRRIIPLLIVVSLTLLTVGWLMLDPVNYKDLGDQIGHSITFLSNIFFMRELDYFDQEVIKKYMLHTWSLSVEWQFYIIYPVILIVFKKYFSIKNLKIILVVGLALSFVISIYSTIHWPTYAYYLLPSRAWEMMLGGVAYIYPLGISKNNKKYVYFIGITLIISSYFLMNGESAWPGYLAFFPAFGAFLIIVANLKANLITDNFIFQFIGKCSYSIYMWHWPLLVIFRAIDYELNIYLYLIITLILSSLSYSFVEKKKWNVLFVLFISLLVYLASCYVSIDGVDSRVNQDFQLERGQFRAKFEGHMNLYRDDDGAVYINGNENDFEYIVIGDSFARQYNSYFHSNNLKVATLAIDGCSSYKNFYNPKYYNQKKIQTCKDRYEYELKFIKEHPGKTIIISRGWPAMGSYYRNKTTNELLKGDIKENIISELNLFLKETKPYVKSYYLVARNQRSNIIPFEYLAKQSLPVYKLFNMELTEKTIAFKPDEYNEFLQKNESGYKFIDTSPALCEKGECFVIKNGLPLFTDYSHLTKEGAEIVGKYIMERIKESENMLNKN
jgi:peptidoglycan/LPS O-acetylase OafA/YrhL